jgi:lipoate-protein ligase A
MKLYHLKHVPWLDSQLLYHAMPRVGTEGLLILAPAQPYACIGYHQDVQQEADLEYCREHGIPVFRREVGGGAVYLDGNQLFYQLVLHRSNPLTHGDKATFYHRMLQPVADTYADLGVRANYRPINDIVTAEGRKISGNGAAEIGDYIILVGNLIADFDYASMVRVLRVPDEKFRDKVFRTMRENLTTVKREIGRLPTWDEMATPLIQRLEQVLGPLELAEISQEVRQQAQALQGPFLSEEWLYKKGRTSPGREVKIAEGVNVIQRVHKAPGGLLRATIELKGDQLASVSLSGDFFCYPQDAVSELEAVLQEAKVHDVEDVVRAFYAQSRAETPGVTADDWLQVLLP